MARPASVMRHLDHPAVVLARLTLGEAGLLHPLHRARRRGGIDAQGVGEVAHPPRRLQGEHVERVHLTLFDRVVARAVQPVAQPCCGRATPQLAPGETDAHREVVDLALARVGRNVAHGWR